MRWCWMMAAMVAAAVASHEAIAAEQPGPRPDRPGPGSMMMFERLDRNKDGVIEASEVPEGAPEPIKQFLKRADRNDDKKITKDELTAAMNAGPPVLPPQRPGDRDIRGRGDGPPAREGDRRPEADRRGDRGRPDRPPARPESRDRGPADRGPAAAPQWQGRGPQRGPAAPPQWLARGPHRGPMGPAFGPGRGPAAAPQWQGRGPHRGPAAPPQWLAKGPRHGKGPAAPQAKQPPARGGKPAPIAHDGDVKQLQQKVKQLQQELKVLEAKLAKQSPPKEKGKPEQPAPKGKPHGDDRGEKPAKPGKHDPK